MDPKPSGEHKSPARQRCHAHAPASCPGRRLQLLAPAAALVLAQPAVGEALVVASELRTKFGASRLHSSRARSCCHTSASGVSLRLCAVAKATYRFLLARAAHLSVHDVVDPALGVAHHLDATPWRVPSEKTALATLIDVEITAVATARREVDAAVAGLRGEPRPAVPLWGGQAEHELVITVDGNISPK